MTLHTTNSLPFSERCNRVLTSFLWFSQIDTKISIPDQAMKPGNRPDNILISPKYYEAWNRPDSGISYIQAMKPENRLDNILISLKYYEAYNRPNSGIRHREAWRMAR